MARMLPPKDISAEASMTESSSDKISLDLAELDDDFLQTAINDFDLSLGENRQFSDEISNSADHAQQYTLESILNEDDDAEHDEILQTFASTLNSLNTDAGASSRKEAQRRDTVNSVEYPSDVKRRSSLSMTASNRNERSVSQIEKCSLAERNGIVCKQATLTQISVQLRSAIDRADAGSPTALTVGALIAVGTSRGLILLFDSAQVLKLYITEVAQKDVAISALSLNNACDRLLVGNALGAISMFDTINGKCLRQIVDAHPVGNAVLSIKFTDDSRLACFNDSGGSVFMLEFKRVLGVRSANSTCLFSGSRGEVCHIEPLKFERFSQTIVERLNGNNTQHMSAVRRNMESVSAFFARYSLLAMASFTKIYVVTLRPKLTVLYTYPLTSSAKYLPILAWQFVIIQKSESNSGGNQRRFVSPILACARESTILFFQVDYQNVNDISGSGANVNAKVSHNDDATNQFKFIQLQKSEFDFKIRNFCWLNAKTLAILDSVEKLHIIDVRSSTQLQLITSLSSTVSLVYSSSFFKSLATGGYVSEALAVAAASACYETFHCYLGQLFMLGSGSLTLFSLQTWSTRIDDFVNDARLDLALDLALAMYRGDTKALIGLPMDARLRKEKIVDKCIDVLYLYVNRMMKQDCPSSGQLEVLEKHYRKCSTKCVNICMELGRQDVLFDNVYGLVSCDALFQGFFLQSLEDYILSGRLVDDIPPLIIQDFIEFYSQRDDLLLNLEKCILHFDVTKIDLHHVILICRKHRLLDAFIFLFNKAFGDFTTPLEEILTIMQPLEFLNYSSAKAYLRRINQISINNMATVVSQDPTIMYGNKLLVYIHSCLCGQQYPYGGAIQDDQMNDRVRRETFDFLIGKRNTIIDKLLMNEKQRLESDESAFKKSPIASYLDSYLDEESDAASYPILRIFLNLLNFDFLNVLTMTLDEPSFEAIIGLEKKQELIDILIQIGLRSGKASSQLATSSYSQLAGKLFMFLARQIANKNNNIRVDNLIFAQIIEYLCSPDEHDRVDEREQIMFALLAAYSTQIGSVFDIERMLQLARAAKFYTVCEVLYEMRGEYYKIVECYLSKDNSLERQLQVFDVVRQLVSMFYEAPAKSATEEAVTVSPSLINSSLSSPGNLHSRLRSFTQKQQRSGSFFESREIQMKKLQAKLTSGAALKQLISLNASEAVFLLWIEMNIDLRTLIKTISKLNRNERITKPILANDASSIKSFSSSATLDEVSDGDGEEDAEKEAPAPELIEDERKSSLLLYQFMRGLFELTDSIRLKREYMHYMSQFGAEYCELYVDLICLHDPANIVFMLKTSLSEYPLRIEECLRICRERRVFEGSAYLLEKSGQLEAAFSLHLEKMSATIKEMQRNINTFSEKEINVCMQSIDAMLMMIVQLCQRSSCALNDQVKEKIWFALFEEVMKPIRSFYIHPSSETLLHARDNNSDQPLSPTNGDMLTQRLDEIREFFRRLGSYVINSMVGNLSLTTIIDRMIGDPLYGASNFGDIRELMVKMLEMCTYEQTLLSKTATLVSRDVYVKMLAYKKLSCKSFSAFTNSCQYCSKPLDLTYNSIEGSFVMLSIDSSDPSNVSPFVGENDSFESTSFERTASSAQISVSIFHCGHAFHQTCLDTVRAEPSTTCPLCNTSSSSKTNKGRSAKSADAGQRRRSSRVASPQKQEFHRQTGLNPFEEENEESMTEDSKPSQLQTVKSSPIFDSTLTDQQMKRLRVIRSRTSSNAFIDRFKYENTTSQENSLYMPMVGKQKSTNVLLGSQNKLQLAPANIAKFI